MPADSRVKISYVPSSKIIPYSCIFIDIPWNLMFRTLLKNFVPLDHKRLTQQVESIWSPEGNALATLSVRSALDCWLQVMNFPKGSEIIMSAINIPDMVNVIRFHGLVPVPLDIDLDTLAPKVEELEATITPRTKAVLIAHIYGARYDMGPMAEVAHRHKLLVIEDCAESFSGLEYTGHPESDITLFSFGPIKVATALGGALARVKDGEVLAAMRALHEAYPIQPRKVYVEKLLKYSVVGFGLNEPIAPTLLIPPLSAMGVDHKALAVSMVRSFPPSEDFLQKFRLRPCAPLLQLLAHRLTNFDKAAFLSGTDKGRLMESLLCPNVIVPGKKAFLRNYWLFPVLVSDRINVFNELVAAGLDSYLGATQLALVEAPQFAQYRDPVAARHLMENVIYLPISKLVPDHAIQRMASVINRICSSRPAPVFTKPTSTPIAFSVSQIVSSSSVSASSSAAEGAEAPTKLKLAPARSNL
eukprot:GILI01001178.1.p1 GENE.GILI01001178.1~~GILI01001178.1.p1  ORF type:complete len:500 (+),score=142.25 GILI01001178.1:87-1502(+)